jgi:hypothetical protein
MAEHELHRPLAGLAIGISISESEDIALYGFEPVDITMVTVEISRRLISLGAQIVLGHQWRPRGVMESIVRFAQAYQSESPLPIIRNFMAWPDKAALSQSDRRNISSLVEIVEGEECQNDRTSALLEMRSKIAHIAHARICLSGKFHQKTGFNHGVIEEIALTLKLGRPVYLSRMMGGSTNAVIDILEERYSSVSSLNDPSEQTMKYLAQIRDVGVKRFAALCGLQTTDLLELFNAHNVDTIIQLTSRGLMNRRVDLLGAGSNSAFN